jgi:GNAT superfamily N-acetyltransferase
LLGVARYFAIGSHWAELAIVVGDAWQGHGLGKMLLDRLSHVARSSGIQGFRLETTRSNTSLRRLVQSAGLEVREHDDGPSASLEMQLTALAAPEPASAGN